MPTVLLTVLKDYAERSIVAVAVLGLFVGAFVLWLASVITCVTFLVAGAIRVTAVLYRGRRTPEPVTSEAEYPAPRSA